MGTTNKVAIKAPSGFSYINYSVQSDPEQSFTAGSLSTVNKDFDS